jgi:hypothetical protein
VDHVFVYLNLPLIIPSANMIECAPSVEAAIIVVDAQSRPALIASPLRLIAIANLSKSF